MSETSSADADAVRAASASSMSEMEALSSVCGTCSAGGGALVAGGDWWYRGWEKETFDRPRTGLKLAGEAAPERLGLGGGEEGSTLFANRAMRRFSSVSRWLGESLVLLRVLCGKCATAPREAVGECRAVYADGAVGGTDTGWEIPHPGAGDGRGGCGPRDAADGRRGEASSIAEVAYESMMSVPETTLARAV
jgi:hypothetical protein